MADINLLETMSEYYAAQAAATNKARKDQANLVACRTELLANLRPTPTTAELNAIAANPGTVTLAGSLISASKIMRPASAQLLMQRKFPRTS